MLESKSKVLTSTLMSRYFRPELHRVIRPGRRGRFFHFRRCVNAVSTADARAHARTHGRARRSHGPVGTPGAPRGRGRSARTPVSARARVLLVCCVNAWRTARKSMEPAYTQKCSHNATNRDTRGRAFTGQMGNGMVKECACS